MQPLSVAQCPLCCGIPPIQRGPLTDPTQFYALGILNLQLDTDNLENLCPHHYSDDHWHYLSSPKTLNQIAQYDEAESIIEMVNFLVKNYFIAVTCRLIPPRNLPLRIYIIPYDLPNVQGKLRLREEAILTTARQYMTVLFSHVLSDPELWDGHLNPNKVHITATKAYLSKTVDNRTIAEIYTELPSPVAATEYIQRKIPGMRSVLYPYQVNTVNTMLGRELNPQRVPDPLFIQLEALNNMKFYLQPATMEVLAECPQVTEYGGGILCEELGTGKTIMILSLVLATFHQLPRPEESILDPRTVMTPLSFRHFPFSQHSNARKRLFRGAKHGKKRGGLTTEHAVPSLVEILLDYCRIHPRDTGLWHHEDVVEERRLLQSLRFNTPFYHHYDTTITEPTRTRARTVNMGPKVMYLSPATLIIVPPNLLAQWIGEIHKHCEEELRLLVVHSDDDIPCAPVLATKYDIILMTYQRFSTESARKKTSSLHSWNVCTCPEYKESRVPKCRCTNFPNVSPLLQLRWKRLVIDEGHVSGTVDTNLTPFSRALSVENRWIVTGTPTTNLLGIKHGQGSELQYPSTESPIDSSSDLDDDAEDDSLTIRRWTSDDRVDLRKLATMMIDFLAVPQFAANPKMFSNLVVAPLFKSTGPLPGAIQILTQVMSSIMIRHRVEDVECDVLLPIISHETVFLDLDPYARISYNALQAAVAINAIDSQRVGVDYLFHPKNTSSLKTIVQNFSQVMFWHIDSEKLFNVDEMASSANEFTQKVRDRQSSATDIALMDQAVEHVTFAQQNRMWRGLQAHPFVFHHVRNLPDVVYKAWSPIAESFLEASFSLLSTDRLLKLREFALRRPLASRDAIIEHGIHMCDEEDEQRMAQVLRRPREKAKAKHDREETNAALKEKDAGKRAAAPEKILEMQRELQAANEGGIFAEEMRMSEAPPSPTHIRLPRALAPNSTLGPVRIGNSTSSKLDYLLNEVLLYSSTEKFLIFSNSALTLALVAEGLELIDTKYLQYTTRVRPKVREQLVRTFETSDLYRVFLMELKHGARGLNLVTASRVIFCEPVWQADVETQAIKRVHRIGQTRPVTVKTLAIRGTYEEVMTIRRDALKGSGVKQLQLTDDRRMRDFIANPTFMAESSGTYHRPVLNIPLIECSRGDGSDSDRAGTMAHVDVTRAGGAASPTARGGTTDEPPRKKAKGVHFGDQAPD